jgi:hypothetical protein
MSARSARWASATHEELRAELAEYLAEASHPSCPVRVFWKMGPQFRFAGCSEHFARDAGLAVSDLVGIDDFDSRLPWQAQAAKYRSDDLEVFQGGRPKLDILERQGGTTGKTAWVRVGKAPIRVAGGAVIGILGMYELLDHEAGTRLYRERMKAGKG